MEKYNRKAMEKDFRDIIRVMARKRGYGHRDQRLYKKAGDNFIVVLYLFVPMYKGQNYNFSFIVGIKKYSYDDIFWSIMDMETNKKMPQSQRAIGAFKAPEITLYNGDWLVLDDLEEYAKKLLDTIEREVEKFLEKYEINEYIFKYPDLENQRRIQESTLKVLALVDLEMFDAAKEVAQNEINKNNEGDFIFGGKGFFQRSLKYCKKRSKEKQICLLKRKMKLMLSQLQMKDKL